MASARRVDEALRPELGGCADPLWVGRVGRLEVETDVAARDRLVPRGRAPLLFQEVRVGRRPVDAIGSTLRAAPPGHLRQACAPEPKPAEADGKNQADNDKPDSFGTSGSYLAARIARDAPEVHEAMKAGKYPSVRAAAIAAGAGPAHRPGPWAMGRRASTRPATVAAEAEAGEARCMDSLPRVAQAQLRAYLSSANVHIEHPLDRQRFNLFVAVCELARAPECGAELRAALRTAGFSEEKAERLVTIYAHGREIIRALPDAQGEISRIAPTVR